jgi:hypothetical protein
MKKHHLLECSATNEWPVATTVTLVTCSSFGHANDADDGACAASIWLTSLSWPNADRLGARRPPHSHLKRRILHCRSLSGLVSRSTLVFHRWLRLLLGASGEVTYC